VVAAKLAFTELQTPGEQQPMISFISKGCHAELRRSMVGRPLRSTLRRSSGWQPSFYDIIDLWCL